jgi:hypothetical protein
MTTTRYGLDPLDPRKCRVCGKPFPVPSLALDCAKKHDEPHEVKP